MSSDGEDEPSKKRPKTATDLIIDQALAEDAARKKAKRGGKEQAAGVPKKKEGMTLAEIEAEEGGTIKESMVGMAQVKRAGTRKQQDQSLLDSTDVPAEVDQFEEKAEVEEEDGMKFTGFNLDEERETGFFDDEGNYVEKKEEGDPGEKDAWMTSDEAKVVSEEVRKKIEARRKAEEEESKVRVAPLTDRQIAAFKMEMAGHMQAGETLAKALKRLGAGQQAQRAMGKREKQRQQQQQQAAGAAAKDATGSGAADAAAVFARITDLADQLLVEGEVDVYDSSREEFERFAAMWMPKQPAVAAGALQGRGRTGCKGRGLPLRGRMTTMRICLGRRMRNPRRRNQPRRRERRRRQGARLTVRRRRQRRPGDSKGRGIWQWVRRSRARGSSLGRRGRRGWVGRVARVRWLRRKVRMPWTTGRGPSRS